MKRILFVTILILSLNSWSTEYFVSLQGKDTNPGTKSLPFRTVQTGVNAARVPGDIVSVRAGRYSGAVTLKYSGISGKPITLRSYPGEKAIIDQGTNYELVKSKALRITLSGGSKDGVKNPIGWLVIEGLEIIHGWDGIKMYKAHDVVIRGCNIHHSFNQGILGYGLRVAIDRNIISNSGFTLPQPNNTAHGIYLSGNYIKITNNQIHSNASTGIQMAGYTNTQPEYNGAKYWLVANNTFAFNKAVAIVIYKSLATNSQILNNIFYNNSKRTNGVSFTSGGGNHVIRYNLFYSSLKLTAINEATGTKYVASNNLYQLNPLFVAPLSFNFRLTSSSPARDKGLRLTTVTKDFAGVTRPQGSGVDIGAFEYYLGQTSTQILAAAPQNLRIMD